MSWYEPKEHAGARFAFGLSAALFLLSPSVFAQAPAATTAMVAPGADAEADRLREEGKAASKAGQFEKAEELYRRAWRLRQGWEIAANLGLTEFRLGKNRDAAEHLSYFLREAPTNRVGEADRKATQETIDKARAKVAALRITVSPAGAEVLVDGQAVGTAPLPGAVFVEPGPVAVEVRRDGYTAVKVSRVGAAGSVEDVELRLVPQSTKLEQRAPRTKLDVQRGPNKAILIAGSVVAIATLGLGVTAGFLSKTKNGEIEDAGGKPKDCPYLIGTVQNSKCNAHNDLEISRANLARASFGGFLSAGIVGATTVIYALVGSKKGTKKPPGATVQMNFHSGWQLAISSTW